MIPDMDHVAYDARIFYCKTEFACFPRECLIIGEKPSAIYSQEKIVSHP